MSHIHTQRIYKLIRRSRLLSEERRGALLRAYDHMNASDLEQLNALLSAEEEIICNAASHAITKLADAQAKSATSDLEALIHASMVTLRKFEEKTDICEDTKKLDSFFDEV
jgi:hypothetical protein